MNERQFEILIGISRQMEKSLQNIEKTFTDTKGTSGKATMALGGLAQSLGAIVSAVNDKKFDSKRAKNILDFSRNLVSISNSVRPKNAKAFSEFAKSISSTFDTLLKSMNPLKIAKLFFANKILFEGKNPLLRRIVVGMQNAFVGADLDKAKKGGKAVKEIGEGILSLSKAAKSLSSIGLQAPLIAVGALVVKKILSLFLKNLDLVLLKKGARNLKPIGEGLISLSKAIGVLGLIGLTAPLALAGALVARAVVGLFVSIGKNAKEIKAGGNSLKSLGKGLIVFSAGVAVLALLTIVGAKAVIAGIGIIALFGLTFWALGKMADSIKRGSRSLALMGLPIFGFSAGLATLALVMMIVKPGAILAGIAVIAGFALVFAIMGNSKVSREIAEGALILILGISVGLFIFSGALYVLGEAMKLWDLERGLMAAGLIAGLGFAIAFVGKQPGIERGAEALFSMSLGLAAFSAGVLVFGAAIKLLQLIFKNDLLEAGVIAGSIIMGLGLAFSFIGEGEVSSQIIQGSEAMGFVGASLVAISLGITLYAGAIKLLQGIFDDLSEAGMIAGSILVGLALAYSTIGIFDAPILAGAVALEAVGVSLISISVGIISFGAAIKVLQTMFDDLEDAGKIAGSILVGLGLAFAAAGALSILIIPGSVAIGTIGASLIIFSLGAMAFAGATRIMMNVFDSELDQIGGKMKSFFTDIGMAFAGIGLLVVPVALGAASMLLMGSSLVIFGTGLLIFGSGMGELDSKGLLIKENDSYTIKGLSIFNKLGDEFADLGWKTLNPMFWLGVASSVGMGGSLTLIGQGLSSAAEALEKVTDMDSLIENIFGDEGLLPSMARSFEKIGETYGGGLLSSWLGDDKVSRGIQVTKGFGEVLKELAGGIVAFSNFTEFPVQVPDAKNPAKLIYSTVDIFGKVIPALNENLPTLLSTLAETFSLIGNRFGAEGGWFSDESPVQKGVNAIKGLGSSLSEVAGGIIAFSRFDEFPIQIPDPKDPSKLIYKAINLFDTLPKIKEVLIGDGSLQGKLTSKSGILMALAEIFAEIGNKYGDEDGFLGIGGSKGAVKKGVDAVKGLGSVVSELANGIIAFANMGRGLPNYDKDGKFNGTYTPFRIEDVKNNIHLVLKSLPDAFKDIDEKTMKDAKKKADAAAPLASAVAEIAKAFAELQTKKEGEVSSQSMTEIVADISKTLSAIVNDVFSDKVSIKQLIDAKRKAEIAKSLATSVASFGQSLMSIQEDRKAKSLPSIASDISKALSTILNSPTVTLDKASQLEKIGEIFEKFASYGDSLSKFADSLTKTGNAFKGFSDGFGSFSTRLDKFSKFENVFSNLVRNQYTFKFDQFAKSMGTLKGNVNDFSVEKLKMTDSLMKSLAILSKSPEATGEAIKESINEALEKLVEAIQDLQEKVAPAASAQVSPSPATPAFSVSNIPAAPAPVAAPTAPVQDMSSVVRSITALQSSIESLSRKFVIGTNGGIKVTDQ